MAKLIDSYWIQHNLQPSADVLNWQKSQTFKLSSLAGVWGCILYPQLWVVPFLDAKTEFCNPGLKKNEKKDWGKKIYLHPFPSMELIHFSWIAYQNLWLEFFFCVKDTTYRNASGFRVYDSNCSFCGGI